MQLKRRHALYCLIVMSVLTMCLPAHAQSLKDIRARQHMVCGTVTAVDDWNAEETHGDLSGLGGEICRAIAVAILGGTDGLEMVRFPSEINALTALKDGKVEVAVGISPSVVSAVSFGVEFGPPVFYDSQRILVSKSSGIKDLAGLRDELICGLDMGAAERTLHDELSRRNIAYSLMSHSEQGEMDAAILVRRCAAGIGTESRLAESRANFGAHAEEFAFLPERLSLDPVVPAFRQHDPNFALIVNWTVGALIEAEALGITQRNVAQAKTRTDIRAEQLLGHDFATAQALGLAHDWAAKVIATTGNYGEIFERTVGKPYQLDRGLNALWIDGGLMQAPPMH